MSLPRYSFAGLIVESSIALPEAVRATSDAPPSCRFSLAGPGDAPPSPPPLAPGRGLAIAATDGGFVLAFAGSALFSVDHEGRKILCWPDPALGVATTRHLLLDQVLPRVLSLRGHLVLHASVVASPAGVGAGAFLGRSGAGKSTLAAALVAAGWRLLSDDVLVLEEHGGRARAWPTYPGLRLWPDVVGQLGATAPAEPVGQHSDKRRIAVARFTAQPTPLRRLYFLEEAPPPGDPATAPVQIRPMRTRETLVAAFTQEFRLARVDVPSLQPILDRLAGSSALRRCRQIAYHRRISALPAVVEAIRRDLHTATPPAGPAATARGVW